MNCFFAQILACSYGKQVHQWHLSPKVKPVAGLSSLLLALQVMILRITMAWGHMNTSFLHMCEISELTPGSSTQLQNGWEANWGEKEKLTRSHPSKTSVQAS